MAEKKRDTKRQTKAGMMSENSDRTAGGRDESDAEEKSGDAPKVSKETAEGRREDKPLH